MVPKKNMMLCYPNRIEEAELKGGAWSETLPLAHAQDRLLALRTRSIDTALDSTRFTVTLPKIRTIRSLALIDHNLSVTAQYRISAYVRPDDPEPMMTTLWLPVWEIIYPYGSVPFEDEHFWTGRPTPEDVQGYRIDLIYLTEQVIRARHWQIEISDPGNPDGYVEFGRVWISDAWQPVYNMSYPESAGYQSRTTVSEAYSGAETFGIKRGRRYQRCSLDWLNTAEAMGRAWELQRNIDIHGEVLFIFDPTDAVNRHRRSFLGRLRQLSALEHPYLDTYRLPLEIQEIL